MPNSASARERAAAPRRARSAGAATSAPSARARTSGSPGATRRAGLTVADQLRDAADRRRHHGQSGGHRLEHGHRHSLRSAREDEHVRRRQQLGDVSSFAEQHDRVPQAESGDLALDLRPVGTVADDEHPRAARRQPGRRTHQREEVLRLAQPTDGQHRGRPVGHRGMAAPRAIQAHAVADHDRGVGAAGPRADARCQLALGDADRPRGERAHGAVRPQVCRRGHAGVRLERPAVHGEQAHRYPRQRRRQPPEHAGLGAVRVDHVRAHAADQPHQLEQAAQVLTRAEGALYVPERHEADPGRGRLLGEPAGAVRRDGHVELLPQRGQQRGDVGLRSTDLGQGDQHEHAPARHGGGMYPCAELTPAARRG